VKGPLDAVVGGGMMRVMSDPAPAAVRLMLVDDHPLVRDGLRVRLEGVPGFRVVAEAGSAQAAIELAPQVRPDLVVMDVGLRGGNGIAATAALLQASPGLRVLMLSMFDNAEYVREALRAGAKGYVLKDSPAEEMVSAIHAVMAGETFLSAALSKQPQGGVALDSPVTPREREVLALIAEGLPSREIGERLGMGVRTVETHRTHLRRKLGLPSAAALVRYAVENRQKPG
jgi:two-component system, NarL family, nitrate/nitrite response regulator NarL